MKLENPKVEPQTIVKLVLNKLPLIRSETVKQVKQEKQKLIPSDIGIKVYNFCIKEFAQLFDYDFTKQMEARLDLIEHNAEPWRNVCKDTWDSYKDKYNELKKTTKAKEQKDSIQLSNDIEAIQTRKGPFLVKDKKILGWPEQIKFESITDTIVEEFLKKNIDDILGQHDNKPLIKKKGPYGYYVKYDGQNIKYEETDTLDTLIAKITNKSEALLHVLGEFEFRKGPYGNYMMKKQISSSGKKPSFVSIPSELNPKDLTMEAAKKIYETGLTMKKKYKK